MRALVMCVSVFVGFLLDTIVFSRLGVYGVQLNTLTILVVLFSILCGAYSGAAAGIAGGLLVDIMFGQHLGLSSLQYLIIGILAGIFYNRYYADNVLLPAIVVGASSILKEILSALFMLLLGVQFDLAIIMIRYVVPCAIVSAAVAIPLFLWYRHIFAPQIKRRGR